MPIVTDILDELHPAANPTIPVKGIMISEEYTSPYYIYADSQENITEILERSLAVRNNPSSQLSGTPFQNIISEAFLRAGADLYSLDKQLSELPGMKQFKRGMVIKALTEEGQPLIGYNAAPEKLVGSIRNFFPNDHIAVLNDSIYVLRTTSEVTSRFEIDHFEDFEMVLAKHGAYAIVGNSSQWLKGLKVLYRQCSQILPVAVAVRYGSESARRVLDYNRYSFYYTVFLAERASKRTMGAEDVLYLCDAAVLTLTRYDRQFNSDLRDTLFIYLMRDRNISETARELHVHRNTVIYKLNQIKGLIGDKMDDPYVRHSLISSCMIIRYIENYRRREVDLPPVEKSLLKKNL